MSAVKTESAWHRFISDFARSKAALISLVVICILILVAAGAQWLTPQNPYDLAQLSILNGKLEPGAMHPDGRYRFLLGTDDQGRDLFSAIIYGLRISLGVGIASSIIALAVGAFLGLVAGYFGGWVDSLIMRIVDFQLSFPAILIALVLLSIMGPGIDKVVIALVAVQWAYYARTIRGTALSERTKEYIEAAVCLNFSSARIVFRHLLPNCIPPLMVVTAVNVGHAISLEATLSFLGLGVPVTQPSLGMLIATGYQYMLSGIYWISFYPGLALLLTIVSINVVGDQLRDVLNPRLQR
jgi:peptide/nickel transport system permease protein